MIALNKSIKNYMVTFEASYEAKNEALLKEYKEARLAEADRYKKEMALYPGLLKAAQENYEKELAEYNKKSFGKKLLEKQLLEESTKPVKILPPKPYLNEIEKPILQSSYDYKVLASTYLKLEGYQNAPSNALKITVLLYGFDYTQPRTIDVQESRISTGTTSPTNTYKATLYHTEFSYRHPMAIKVTAPDGKELLSITPPELNLYKIYKSPNTDRGLTINRDLLVKNMEEKVLQDNLTYINNLLNDRFGFSSPSRTAKIFFVKKGGDEYADLTTAFNEVSAALPMLQQDSNTAKEKLDKACSTWNTALSQSDMNNKKARIDKDITLGICSNLLEAYFATGNVREGKALLDKMSSFSLSFTERKMKNDFEALFTDLKTRQQNNL
jgi:hypothetical protein